jgi:hypothetical protein
VSGITCSANQGGKKPSSSSSSHIAPNSYDLFLSIFLSLSLSQLNFRELVLMFLGFFLILDSLVDFFCLCVYTPVCSLSLSLPFDSYKQQPFAVLTQKKKKRESRVELDAILHLFTTVPFSPLPLLLLCLLYNRRR